MAGEESDSTTDRRAHNPLSDSTADVSSSCQPGAKMLIEPVELSAEEFAFTVLDESHWMACEALNETVMAAMKHADLPNWKRMFAIVSQFTAVCEGLCRSA